MRGGSLWVDFYFFLNFDAVELNFGFDCCYVSLRLLSMRDDGGRMWRGGYHHLYVSGFRLGFSLCFGPTWYEREILVSSFELPAFQLPALSLEITWLSLCLVVFAVVQCWEDRIESTGQRQKARVGFLPLSPLSPVQCLTARRRICASRSSLSLHFYVC